VLRDWLDLHLRKGKAVTAKLASSKPFFHPKVLIVHSPKEQFAIVSSGNLSDGGLQTNCECGVFVDDAPTVAMLCVWFDAQFAIGEPLKEQMIREYEPEYTKAKKPNSSSNTIHNLELLLLDYVSRGLPVRLIPSAVYPDSLIHFQFVVHVVEQFLRGSVIRPALHN
jgi:phosphatidylserine/phosphatidylglycerophosphate/cardiolipin synthase-like enzyme